MNEQQQAQVLAIVQTIMHIAENALKGDSEANLFMRYFLSEMKNLSEEQTLYVRQGAKLNYLGMLRGNCPAGTELQYYKTGGRICKKCVKKHQDGNSVDNPIDQFRSERCGGKMKKKAVGGTVDQPAKYNKGFCKKH